MTKPAALEVTTKEGGDWVKFDGQRGAVHSIKFDDGSIWDTVNGWRSKRRCRVPMGREIQDEA